MDITGNIFTKNGITAAQGCEAFYQIGSFIMLFSVQTKWMVFAAETVAVSPEGAAGKAVPVVTGY